MSQPMSDPSTPPMPPPVAPPGQQANPGAESYFASNSHGNHAQFQGFPNIPTFANVPFYPTPPMPALAGTPGAFVSPSTAVMCILVVGALYWAFKNVDAIGSLPILESVMGGAPPAAAVEVTKESSSSSKSSSSSSRETSKEVTAGVTLPSLPPISPYAFVSLFCFALLAAVLIQGPLGLGDAFSGKQPLRFGGVDNAVKPMTDANTLLGILPMNLNIGPQVAASSGPSVSSLQEPAPQMGGRGQTGPGGVSQWDWFVNPSAMRLCLSPSTSAPAEQIDRRTVPPWNRDAHQPGGAPSEGNALGGTTAPAGLSQAQTYAFLNLPLILQSVPFCRSSPESCTSLLANTDSSELARMLSPLLGGQVDVNSLLALLGRQTTAQPNPIPLVPSKGFLGSVQGVQNIENAFYPLLIGAIGLIILFDYGT